jgi:hypothetical protein
LASCTGTRVRLTGYAEILQHSCVRHSYTNCARSELFFWVWQNSGWMSIQLKHPSFHRIWWITSSAVCKRFVFQRENKGRMLVLSWQNSGGLCSIHFLYFLVPEEVGFVGLSFVNPRSFVVYRTQCLSGLTCEVKNVDKCKRTWMCDDSRWRSDKIICDENSGWIVYSVYDQSGIREEFCVAALVGRSVNADSKVGFFLVCVWTSAVWTVCTGRQTIRLGCVVVETRLDVFDYLWQPVVWMDAQLFLFKRSYWFTLVKDRRLDLLDCRLTTACGQCTQDDSKA